MNLISKIFSAPDLRRKVLFTLGIIALYRVLAFIPTPGVDVAAMSRLAGGTFGVLSMFTGGAFENFSIILMGLGPYITSSIIIQLLTVIVPRFEELKKEGQAGRQKLTTYGRYLAVPLALLQSYGMILLINQSAGGGVVASTAFGALIPLMIVVTGGTMLLMWLGELISERGIGNGISLLIFAGIVASVPTQILQNLSKASTAANFVPVIILALITLILLVLIVLFSEGERRVPVTYAARSTAGSAGVSYLPFRVNMAGMIPIIFAVSIIAFPSIVASFFVNAEAAWLRSLATAMANPFAQTSLAYIALYFALVVGFAFFYVSITFQPAEYADTLQKRGGFIAGVRPGRETAAFLERVVMHLTLFGGVFIGLVAIAPLVLQRAFTEFQLGAVTMLVSGAGLIIMVSTVLELRRQVRAQLEMHEYGKFVG